VRLWVAVGRSLTTVRIPQGEVPTRACAHHRVGVRVKVSGEPARGCGNGRVEATHSVEGHAVGGDELNGRLTLDA
jgi:hypothetical protein